MPNDDFSLGLAESLFGPAGLTGSGDGTQVFDILSTPPPASVRRIAQECLKELDELISIWQVAVAQLEDYRRGRVPADEIRTQAMAAFELIFRLIGGLPVSAALTRTPSLIGARRAQQRMPLDAVLAAVRLDFRVVWQAMLLQATPEEENDLVGSAFRVWEAVEQMAVALSRAYQEAVEEMARSRADERQLWFNRLCEAAPTDTQTVVSAARVLGLPVAGRYLVAVCRDRESNALRQALGVMKGHTGALHLQPSAHGEVLVAQENTRAAVSAALPAVPMCFVDRVDGLAGVPAAVQIAQRAATAMDETMTSPTPVDELWFALLLRTTTIDVDLLRRRVLGALLDLRPPAREVLISAFRLYWDTGSVSDTAARAFCHRNTILNRIGELNRITGLDVRRPRDASILQLALETERITAIGPH